MTKETDFMIQALFQRESMDEITLDELKGHAEEFPYSSIVQFLYTCKLKSQYHLDFPEAVSKTALFFDDSSWLNYQLREEAEKGNFRKILYDSNYNNTNEDEVVEGVDGLNLPAEGRGIEEMSREVEGGLEKLNLLAEVEEVEEVEGVEVDFDENEGVFHESTEVQTNEKIDPKVNETNTSPDTNNDFEFPLTPYHTVDYFASLGIKINLESDKDELSRKVKSFTAWLKTMKRLQPDAETVTVKDIQSILNTHKDKERQSEAVFTEAMAEVYLKQGLREKAIEVYDKLSLQNPLNSHNFADKISQIKENKI
jgi:hypothetical protein